MNPYFLGLAHGFILIALTGVSCEHLNAVRLPSSPIQLSGAEKTGTLIYPMSTLTVNIRFESDEEWPYLNQSSIDGYTDWNKSPCYIGLRASQWTMVAKPSRGEAILEIENDNIGRVISHEILHCLRGAWHPAWAEIINNRLFISSSPGRPLERRDGD